MPFVVIYENARMLKGLDEFATTARGVPGGDVSCSGQDSVFMTTPELAEARLFDSEEQATAFSRERPVLDDAHLVARVVECVERTQVVDRVLSK